MGKKIQFILPVVVLMLLACESHQQPWNPVFEETSFRYLENSISNTLYAINTAEKQLKPEQGSEGYASLEKARQICLTLKDYYIPLTGVRHNIYDADRFFYLKDKDNAMGRLEASRSVVEKINKSAKGGSIDRALAELISMIDECILSLDENKKHTYDKFQKLGHKVNLMLIRGELIVSEMKFS